MNEFSFIEANSVSKQFSGNSYKSVDSVSVRIHSGQKFGIFGPNGAGKTTLISMLCGLQQPDSGSVNFQLSTRLPAQEARKYIGYVPQDFAFYPELSAYENLRYFGKLYNISTEQVQQRAERMLSRLGLAEFADKKVRNFSGGMKRRVNLAIGLLHEPKVLFLDEPTVGVDVQSRSAIMSFLEELNTQGTTVIYTSHHLDEAESFCDYVFLMDKGKVVTEGEISSLLTENGISLEQLFLHHTGTAYRDA